MTGGGLEPTKDGASSSQADRQRSQDQPSSSKNQGDSTEATTTPESVWVFGYGSLLWKINFPYEDKVVGHVKGFARRFWQGSIDHRGVPGAPGRVVTLIEAAEEETWGIAYKVLPSDVPEVMAYLDHRERGGYTTHKMLFHPQPKPKPKLDSKQMTLSVLAYVATELNPNYLGPAPIEDVAKQVVGSRGPSGCNTEYLLNLAQAMREIAPGVDDEHLFGLEGKVREQLEVKLKVTVNTSTAVKLDPLVVDDKCTCNFCYCTTKSAMVKPEIPCKISR